MASTYPGAIDSTADSGSLDLPNDDSIVLNLPSQVKAGAHAAIIAVETTLGVNPQGSEATVDARIGAVEGSLGTAAALDTGNASGEIPVLGASGVFDLARLATGTPDGTKFVADDGTLQTPAGGGGSSRLTHGTGMPNSVVTGSPGDEYIDDAITNGAFKWAKKSGTATTSGWVCVDGDTGWRNIGKITGITEDLRIKRIGRAVYLTQIGDSLTTNTAVTNIQLGLAAGFVSSLRTEMLIVASGAIKGRFMVKAINPYIYATVNEVASYCALSGGNWVTDDSWPPTLPGTAV